MSARRRGLGRGLDALIEPPGESIRMLAPDDLEPNRQQPRSRFEESALGELADSIRSQGILQPLIATRTDDGRYLILAGERRWRAARLAGLERLPVLVREDVDERGRLEIALVENLQRADLDAIEEAEAFRVLAERHGLSHDEIGGRVGRSRAAISNSLRLLKLESEVQDLVRDGRLEAGHVRPLVGLEPDRQKSLAARAARGGWSARRVEREAGRDKPPRRTPAPVDGNTAAAAESLTRELQTRVEIRRRKKGGEIRIRFHSEEELMRLYDRLMGSPRRGD